MQDFDAKTVGTVRSYAFVHLPPSAYKSSDASAPWLWCDPRLQDECSAAVRAARLVALTLFALFVAPFRSGVSASERGTDAAQAAWLLESAEPVRERAAICRGCRSVQRYMHGIVKRVLRAKAAEASEVQTVYLVVRRSHGPPASPIPVNPDIHAPPTDRFPSFSLFSLLQGFIPALVCSALCPGLSWADLPFRSLVPFQLGFAAQKALPALRAHSLTPRFPEGESLYVCC